MDLKPIGKNIQKYRKQRGLSQEQLAEMVDLTSNYISLVESGKRCLALDKFVAILNALDISSDVILSDVLNEHHLIQGYLLKEELSTLNKDDIEEIYRVVETMIESTKKRK